MSFGDQYGIPQDAHMIFDVRFLPNPHFFEGLKERTGKDKEVIDYIMSKDQSVEFINKISLFLEYLYLSDGMQRISLLHPHPSV